jgi:hypothetical protein
MDSPTGDPYTGRARLGFPSAFALGRSSSVLSSSNRSFRSRCDQKLSLLALFSRFALRRCTWPYTSALDGPPSLGRSGTSTALGRGAKSGAWRLPSASTGVPAEPPLLRPLRGAHLVRPTSRPIAHPSKGYP